MRHRQCCAAPTTCRVKSTTSGYRSKRKFKLKCYPKLLYCRSLPEPKKHNPARRADRDSKSDTDCCREPGEIIRGGKAAIFHARIIVHTTAPPSARARNRPINPTAKPSADGMVTVMVRNDRAIISIYIATLLPRVAHLTRPPPATRRPRQ